MGEPLSGWLMLALLGNALAILAGAAPATTMLVLDRSVFRDDGYVVLAGTVPASGEAGLSASAALLAPEAPAKTEARLVADVAELIDFGPEVAFRPAPPVICVPRDRHRPDRSTCNPRRAR